LLVSLAGSLAGKRITPLLHTNCTLFGAAIDPLGTLLATPFDPLRLLRAKLRPWLGAALDPLGLLRPELRPGFAAAFRPLGLASFALLRGSTALAAAPILGRRLHRQCRYHYGGCQCGPATVLQECSNRHSGIS
jgi:hypothetical protein